MAPPSSISYPPVQLQAAGLLRPGIVGDMRCVVDPAMHTTLARYPAASPRGVQLAAGAECNAFAEGSDRPAMERAAMRHRAAVAAEARVTGIGGNLVAKSGKPIVEEDEELRVSAQVVRWSSEECRRARGRMAPVARPSIAGQGGARALRACLRLRALEPSGPDLCTQDCQDSGGALRCGARAGARGSGREMSLVQSRLDAGVSAKRAGQPRLPADVR